MKKKLGAGLALLACLTVLTGCGETTNNTTGNTTNTGTNNQAQPQVKVNTNENVIKDQELEGFKFQNTSLVYENGTSTLVSSVTNTSSQTQNLSEFAIHVKDADGNEIITLSGYIGGSVEPGETRTINSSYGSDITNAASITYEVLR